MKFIKKIWIITFGILSIFALNLWYCLPTWPTHSEFDPNSRYRIWVDEDEDTDKWAYTFNEKLNWVLHLPEKEKYETSLWYVIALIQITINWTLWILAFVALIYMLYCGALVISSWSDDKNASKGKKWIYTAAIAIAWVGLSWLIISAMLRFIKLISK